MSYRTGPKIVTDGLVLCLDAADRNSYPGTGSTWGDLSGNGNNGTFGASTAAPTFSSSNGGCIVFDGSNDYVSTSFAINGTNSFTACCWFKLNTVVKNWHSIVDAYKDSIDRNFQLWVHNNSKLYIYHLGTAHSGDGLLAINTWYNAVFSYSGSGNGILYLNNFVLNASIPKGAGTGGNINVNIGARTDLNSSSHTDGNIAQFSIYNRALSANEVRQNFEATKGRFGL
jgi:hypothetical protein